MNLVVSSRYRQCGFISGLVMSCVAIIASLIFSYLEYKQPRRLIDLAIDFPEDEQK